MADDYKALLFGSLLPAQKSKSEKKLNAKGMFQLSVVSLHGLTWALA